MSESNDNASTVALLLVLFEHQTSRALLCTNFTEISLIVNCYTFPKLKIRNLNQKIFKIKLMVVQDYSAKMGTIKKGLEHKESLLSIFVVLS